jgi:hypothetical protein
MVETQKATFTAETRSKEGVRFQVPRVRKSLTLDTYSASPRLGGRMSFGY